jgi:hypothetical protein
MQFTQLLLQSVPNYSLTELLTYFLIGLSREPIQRRFQFTPFDFHLGRVGVTRDPNRTAPEEDASSKWIG